MPPESSNDHARRSLADHVAAAGDDATAQADIEAGGETDDDVRLAELGTELELTSCVE